LNCIEVFKDLKSDQEVLALIVHAREEQNLKFSSECLELLFKRNYLDASEYLLENYYNGTSIDTEIILKSAANYIQRKQDQVIFQLKERILKAKGEQFPNARPILYWA